jgi:DNA-binding NtrC family response regulator
MARILVIDDDLYIRNGCAKIITKDGGSVVCAENGGDGLRELRNRPDDFDAVLVDLLMPEMDGMAVLDQILALNPHLPVIIMTGSITESSANEITRKGAFDCIPKPFTPDELRAVIRKALKKI